MTFKLPDELAAEIRALMHRADYTPRDAWEAIARRCAHVCEAAPYGQGDFEWGPQDYVAAILADFGLDEKEG